MFPIALDLSVLPVILVGNGPKTLRRLGLLELCGAEHIRIFSDEPSDALIERAGSRLVRRLPEAVDYAAARLVMIVDIVEEKAEALAALARESKVLVNLEDNKPCSDFYFPSFVKRGDLLLAVSSGGKSPTLSRSIKGWLEKTFDESWASKLDELAEKRVEWQASGLSYNEIKQQSESWIKAHYDITL